MSKVWVVEPFEDGTCRVYWVKTNDDGSAEISKPAWCWTSMVLFPGDGQELETGDLWPAAVPPPDPASG